LPEAVDGTEVIRGGDDGALARKKAGLRVHQSRDRVIQLVKSKINLKKFTHNLSILLYL
jgi:hypothetical protein